MTQFQRQYGQGSWLMVCAALWSACAIGACKPETKRVGATQTVVSINSDLSVGTELVRIDVALFPVDGRQSPIEQRTFELTASRPREGEVRLPFSFGISRSKADRFLLVVTGYGYVGADMVETPVLEQKTIASFQGQQTLLIKIFLGRVCFRNLCTDEATCYPSAEGGVAAGACGPIPKSSTRRIMPGDEERAWGVEDPDNQDKPEPCGPGSVPAAKPPACSCESGYKPAPDGRSCERLSWSVEKRVSAPAASAGHVQLFLGADGVARALWDQEAPEPRAIMTSEYLPKTASWSVPAPLDPDSAEGSEGVRIVSKNGRAVASWFRVPDYSKIWFSYFTMDMRWAPPRIVAEGDIQDFQSAIDGDGNAMFIWAQSPILEVKARYFDAALNALQNEVVIGGNTGGLWPRDTAVASGAPGHFTGAWVGFRNELELNYTRFVAGTGWSTSQVLATGQLGSPSLALDGNGDALLAWREEGDQLAWGVVQPGGKGERKGVIATDLQGAPVMLVDASNNAVLMWRGVSNPYLSRRAAGGMFGSGVQIPGGPGMDESVQALSADIDAAGNVIAVWGGGAGELPSSVWWSFCPAGKPCSTASPLTAAQGVTRVSDPVVVAAEAGQAIALWSQSAGRGAPRTVVARRLQ